MRELAALGLGRRRLHRVRGDSMEPTLHDGDLLFVKPPTRRGHRPGDLVVVRHPSRGIHLVKRVATVGRDGRLRVVGDNDDGSTDSRSFGAIDPDRVLGQVTFSWSSR